MQVKVIKSNSQKAIFQLFASTSLTVGKDYLVTGGDNGTATVTVKRVKPGKALVHYTYDSPSLDVGKMYKVSEKSRAYQADAGGHSIRSIKKIIGGNFMMTRSKSSYSSDGFSYSSPATTTLTAAGMYGTKNVKNSHGYIGQISMTDYGFGKSGHLVGGYFYDYNLVDDVAENEFVYAIRGTGCAGIPLGDGDSSFGLYVSPRFVGKWYGFSPNLAVTGDVGFDYFQWFGSEVSHSQSGISMNIGFVALF